MQYEEGHGWSKDRQKAKQDHVCSTAYINLSVIDTQEERRGLTFHIPPPTTGNTHQFDSTLLPIS